MNLPTAPAQDFDPGILPETSADGRLVVWAPAGTDRDARPWERIGSVARAEVASKDGICSVAATSVPTRRKSGGLIGGLLGRIRGSSTDKALALPDGRLVEPCGKRWADLDLAWADDGSQPLDEAMLLARWPGCESIRRLGENLFAVYGVGTANGHAGHGGPRSERGTGTRGTASQSPFPPRLIVERALALAVEAGDLRGEVVARSDLGFIALGDGDARGASAMLDKALVLARRAGDRPQIADLLGLLGLAASHLGHDARAIDLIEQGIAEARAAGDPFAEKALLERRGQIESNRKQAERSLVSYELALTLARQVGDHHQAGFLLWRIGAIHAERGDRDGALARCSEAIDLFRRLGRPHAAWFSQHLERYRNDMSVALTIPTGAERGTGTRSTASQSPFPLDSRAGVLQMAVSASKAMARFIGSGMVTVSPEIRDWRLATCKGCAHHTGIRCRVCGCFTDVKTRLGGEACPIGKW